MAAATAQQNHQNFLGSPVSKGSVPSPSAPSPTLTGKNGSNLTNSGNRGCESPKSPPSHLHHTTTASPALSTSSSTSQNHLHQHHHNLLLSQHQQSIPISAAQQQSLLQTLQSHQQSVYSMSPAGGQHQHHQLVSGLFGDLGASLPSPSRAETCNVQRVSPSSLHHHQAAAKGGGEKNNGNEKCNNFSMLSNAMDSSSVTTVNNRTTPSTPSPAGMNNNHSHNHHPHQTTPHLPKAALTANVGGGGGRASDLNPDEMTDLEELEQFAKTFKQRRIKLGKFVCLSLLFGSASECSISFGPLQQDTFTFKLSRLSHAKQRV